MKHEVVWAKGLTKREKSKMTGFFAGNLHSIYVSGISVSAPDLSYLKPNDRPANGDDILISIMNCHGEDGKRYFTIPVDRTDDVCEALQKAQKESLLRHNKVLTSNR